MPTVLAHKLIVGASLGLGVLDLAWLDLALAPRALAGAGEHGDAATEPAALARAEGAPPPAVPAPPPASAEASPPANETPPAELPAHGAPAAIARSHAAVDEPATDEPTIEIAIDKQVYFASMRAELDGTAREVLDSLVRNVPASATIVLDGHADYRGEETYNKKLSRRRAQNVAAYLVEHGIAHERIRIGYIGEEAPHDADELWRDRRVDIQISGGPR